MIIGTTEIRTPMEYSSDYQATWRHELAKVLEQDILAAGFRIPYDELVARQRKYLSCAGKPDAERHITNMMLTQTWDSPDKSVVVANRLYGSTGTSQIKDRMEAMLLCPEFAYSHIARCFRMTEHQVSTYERLFFNIREKDGTLPTAKGLLDFFALRGAAAATSPADQPGHWRSIAVEHGGAALISYWGWKDRMLADDYNYLDMQSHLMPMVYKNFEKKLRFDMLDSRALSETLGNLIKQFADLQRDGILSNNDRVSPDALFAKILAMAGAPTRITPDDAQQARAQEALEAKRKQISESATSGIKAAAESLDNITRQIKEIDNASQPQ